MSTPSSPDTAARPPRPLHPIIKNELQPQTQIKTESPQPQPQTQLPLPLQQQQTMQSAPTPPTRPQLQTPVSGVPTSVRPGEYLVLIAPNPRQPGVPGMRYPSYLPIQGHPRMIGTPGATILQRPTLIRGVNQPGFGVHPGVISTSQPFGMAGVPASMAPGPGSPVIHQAGNNIPNSASHAPSQMTPQDALTKGTNFLNSLLTKVHLKSKKTVVQNLIQALVDGRMSPEDFTVTLQRELNSEPQTQLAPFLTLMLPHLRLSMNAGVTKLPGIRPPGMQPPPPLATLPPPPTGHLHQPPSIPSTSTATTKDAQPINNAIMTNNVVVPTPTPPTSTTMPAPSAPPAAKKKKVPLPPGQKSAYAIKKEAREARKREKELAQQNVKLEKVDGQDEAELKTDKTPPKPKPDRPKQSKQKKTEKQLESLSATLRDDDDVNDVAAMGGVNLAEESQKIMASGAELVGTQIRSCKDEAFFDLTYLSAKISRIVKKYDLPEPSTDVVTLISHATQERLKDIVERLGVLAEHRTENLRLNPKYEVSNDIKGQMKFLAELDRIEKRRYEEQERELLLRVAKSRSKVEDPEQQKLRQKAKDMQRAEQEEVRQREANQTALLAIGPRKKLKTDSASTVSSFSQSSSFKDTKPSDVRTDSVRRVKRVNMRDLQVLLELDRVYLDRLIKSLC
uniref:Transcription initiation factor TFIID subunit 4 n=1 Tax=Aceria tosichella TaxID=561515 RepID=A0A6G1SAC6_9ACAR